MKLKRSTQGLLLAALVCGAGVAIYEGTIAPEQREQRDRGTDLLAIAATDIETIEIETPDLSLRFERLAEPVQIDLDGDANEFAIAEWEFVQLNGAASEVEPEEPEEAAATEPEDETAAATDAEELAEDSAKDSAEAPADEEPGDTVSEGADETADEAADPAETPDNEPPGDEASEPDNGSTTEPTPARQAYMDYLFGAIERAGSDRTIAASADSLEDYGLASARLQLTLVLKDGTRHVLELGDRDFTQSFVYGLLDRAEDAAENTEEFEVLLLSPDLINAIDREIDDWDATVAIGSDLDLPAPELDTAPEAPPTEPREATEAEADREAETEAVPSPESE